MPKNKRKKKDNSSSCSTDTESDSRPSNIPSSNEVEMTSLNSANLYQDSQSTLTLVEGGGPPISLSPIVSKAVIENVENDALPFEGFRSNSVLENLSSDEESVLTPAQRTGNGSNSLPPSSEFLCTVPSASKVYIVEPLAKEIPVSKFFSNDIALSKALANSPFGEAGIEKISKNMMRKLLIVTVKSDAHVNQSTLLNISKIGIWDVKCRLPMNQTSSIGVIGPFGEDTSDDELTEELIQMGHQGIRAERIFKGKDRIKTSMFKIHFPTSVMPSHLCLGYQQYKVSTYIGQPWQCYKCQRFGHSAANCRSGPRCVVCSGPHNVKDCTSSGTNACCNCGGAHTANYGGCPKFKQAKLVEKTRQLYKISYKDAMKKISSSVVKDRQPIVQEISVSQTQYRSVEPNTDRIYSYASAVSKKTVATQTIETPNSQTLQNVSISQLIKLLAKLLSTFNRSDEEANIQATITKLAEETFHVGARDVTKQSYASARSISPRIQCDTQKKLSS
jgi:hypothetical protein